jgi:hypothetical protein
MRRGRRSQEAPPPHPPAPVVAHPARALNGYAADRTLSPVARNDLPRIYVPLTPIDPRTGRPGKPVLVADHKDFTADGRRALASCEYSGQM